MRAAPGSSRPATDPVPTDVPALEVRALTAGYRRRVAVDGADLRIARGERVGIIGPNGAGKTTLLQAIVGAVRPRSGEVRIGGRPARQARRLIGYLPQRAEVDWQHPAQVRDVVAMGRYPHRGPIGRLRADDRAAIAEALARVELTDLAERRVAELSGGQRQRTGLARVLAQQAPVLLLDEPYAGLDAATTAVIERTLRDAAEAGTAVLVVDHDLGRLRPRYDRIVALDGRVIAIGPVDEVVTRSVLATTYGLADVLAELDGDDRPSPDADGCHDGTARDARTSGPTTTSGGAS